MDTTLDNLPTESTICESVACRFFVYLSVAVVVLIIVVAFVYWWAQYLCCGNSNRSEDTRAQSHSMRNIPSRFKAWLKTKSCTSANKNRTAERDILTDGDNLWLDELTDDRAHYVLHEIEPQPHVRLPGYTTPMSPKPIHSSTASKRQYLETEILSPPPEYTARTDQASMVMPDYKRYD